MTVTKADIVNEVYKRHDDMIKGKAVEAVETLLRLAKDFLISGDDLLLSGFGKFSVKEKRERIGRNPQTGEQLTLPPRRVIVFHPSRQLRDKMNRE